MNGEKIVLFVLLALIAGSLIDMLQIVKRIAEDARAARYHSEEIKERLGTVSERLAILARQLTRNLRL